MVDIRKSRYVSADLEIVDLFPHSPKMHDIFPHTTDINGIVSGHVETVVLLSQQPDDFIEVDVDLDELEATSAETKATYAEIRDYVYNERGLKVSNLYIAQVKQKHGIIERINYNPPKSENGRQPQCPEDKAKAIEEALSYFQMI